MDYAIRGERQTAVKYALLLFAFILGEVSFFFMYNQFRAKYIVGCTKSLEQDITTLISYLSYFAVLVCAAWLVLRGAFTAGDFFVAIGMIDQLSYPLISLAEIIRQLVAIKPACGSMEKFLEASPERHPKRSLQELKSEIRFCDVAFSYDGQSPVLRNFHFTVQKGKRYLLKGPSGCGKTTVANLLLRYYDVDSGRLTVDGTPIENYEGTYDCVTIVRQEAVLFHDTLRNNLTMYRAITDESLVQLLQDLGLEKYANVKALDAIVSENGANFSGGEKKRICLGRALLRNTEVLIFDLSQVRVTVSEMVCLVMARRISFAAKPRWPYCRSGWQMPP